MDVLYRTFDSRRRFGVEMEVNRKLTQQQLSQLVKIAHGNHPVDITGWGYTNNNVLWTVKPDSTCGDAGEGGFEVVSPALEGVHHLLDVGRVATSLEKGGAVVNNNCGLHVHVEIKDFGDADAATLLAHWFKIEKVVVNMVPRHRTNGDGGKYCRLFAKKGSLPKEEFGIAEFWALYRPKKLDPKGKRTSITLVNYARTKLYDGEWDYFDRPTVELRLPEGTLDAENVMNWARFFICFVEAVKGKPFPASVGAENIEGVMNILGLAAEGKPLILSPGLYATKRWILNRIIEFGRSAKMKDSAKKLLSDMSFEGIDYAIPKLKAITPPKPRKRRSLRSRPVYQEL